VARAAAMSPRTLNRRFADEAGISWRDFFHHARMLHALERLAAPGARVTDVALEVGFASLGAFTRAFTRFAGENPRVYKQRSKARP
jgi:AraC-like DNA-binding protein